MTDELGRGDWRLGRGDWRQMAGVKVGENMAMRMESREQGGESGSRDRVWGLRYYGKEGAEESGETPGSWAQSLGGQGRTASRSSGSGNRGVRLASAVQAGGPAHLPFLTDACLSPVPEAPVRTH